MILITSPKRVSSYHIDPDCNFLCQIRGEKVIHVFDRYNREVLPEEELERFWTVDKNAAIYKEKYQNRASSYPLKPGVGVHMPVNAPHWVQNADNISVTLAMIFQFPESVLGNIYRTNYYLRKLGLRPSPPGRSKVRDTLKSWTMGSMIAVRNAVKRQSKGSSKKDSHEQDKQLDCRAGVRHGGCDRGGMPHFLAWIETGRPDFVATDDDRYYLAIAGQAYFNHPGTLADPVQVEPGPCIFRPLPFLPAVWAAKLLDLGPLGITMMWRILGGATVGLGWFLLFSLRIPRPWVAASLSLILLSDPGLCQGIPLTRLVTRTLLISEANGGILLGGHWMHIEWRVINPATTMVYLIAAMWAVAWARALPSPGRIALAGLTFGLLFYVYFYYWTAFGLGLLIALALDAGYRRVYFHAGWIGGLIGLPLVISDLLMNKGISLDFHQRCDRFVSIGRLVDLELPVEILGVLAVGGAWVWFRRRDLIFVWSLGAAALLLANEQIVTGLHLSNYHWMYVRGPALSFLMVQAAAEEFGRRYNWSPRSCAVPAVIGLSAFGVGTWIRAVESTRCDAPVNNARVIAAYREEFPGHTRAVRPQQRRGRRRRFRRFRRDPRRSSSPERLERPQ